MFLKSNAILCLLFLIFFNSGCESLNFNKVYSTPNVQPSTMLNNVDHSSFFPNNTFSVNHEMLCFTKVVVVF